MKKRSGFVAVEGADGSGKTTLAVGLARSLRAAGLDVLLTREPGGTPGAEAIRDLLLNPPEAVNWSQRTLAMLFSAARRDHVEKAIAPALAKGQWVISDRFVDSMHVYQSDVDQELRAKLENAALAGHRPDLTFVLDMPAGRAGELAQQMNMFASDSEGWPKSHQRDAMENTTGHSGKVMRKAFLALARADRQRYRVLNAKKGADAVLREALNNVSEQFDLSAELVP